MIAIGRCKIGGSEPCFIIAEAGSNHNGDLKKAKKLIDVAAAAGADAVKFQLFKASRMYPRKAGRSDYLKMNRPIFDIIRQMELPEAWLEILAAACRRKGILFLASVFDEASADLLDPFVSAFKVASYELTHLPLVDHIAKKGKPVLLSTGTATLEEVSEAVGAVRAHQENAVALMQCTAAYPAPPEALNLRAMATMRERFSVAVGFSDHSRDPLLGPLVAVGAGAKLLEKHFTLSNKLPGPDHRFAVEPDELKLMVAKVRQAEQALGTGIKQPHPIEKELWHFARRTIFALRTIEKGETYSPENTAVLRCGKLRRGLQPKEWPSLLGRRAARTVAAESAIQPADVDS